MGEYKLTSERIAAYGLCLRREERAPGTVEKYLRDVRAFAAWTEDRPITQELAAAWKGLLLSTGHALAPSIPCWPPSTICSASWDGASG